MVWKGNRFCDRTHILCSLPVVPPGPLTSGSPGRRAGPARYSLLGGGHLGCRTRPAVAAVVFISAVGLDPIVSGPQPWLVSPCEMGPPWPLVFGGSLACMAGTPLLGPQPAFSAAACSRHVAVGWLCVRRGGPRREVGCLSPQLPSVARQTGTQRPRWPASRARR